MSEYTGGMDVELTPIGEVQSEGEDLPQQQQQQQVAPPTSTELDEIDALLMDDELDPVPPVWPPAVVTAGLGMPVPAVPMMGQPCAHMVRSAVDPLELLRR